jgi:WD40 repeat protein
MGRTALFRGFAISLMCVLTSRLHGQNRRVSTVGAQPLVLTGAIALPGVQGRIDHLASDHKGRLFVSALGNNSEEVLDLSAGRLVHSIAGLPIPQGVAYSPEENKLFVGSDEGKLYIYDGTSWDLIASIEFGDDVDNLRYEPGTERVYVGYGDDEAGAIAIVDAKTNKRLDDQCRLGAHPESFQLEQKGPHIFINLPDLNEIAVVDGNTHEIRKWPVTLQGNFPMALDEGDHRLFVVAREPARLAVFDTNSGRMIAALPCVQNSDDVFYDADRKRIYVPGGEGYISVFQQVDSDHYKLLAKIPSAVGARTAAYFGNGRKGFDVFYVAVPARVDRGAEVLIYTVQN